MQWVSMEKQLNSSGKCSQDFHHCLFLEKSKKTWRRGESSQKKEFTDRIIFMSTFNDIVWHAKWWELCLKFQRKPIIMQMLGWALDTLGPSSEEKWFGSTNHDQKGQWNCTADKMVRRWTSFWLHCSSERKLSNIFEKQSRCGIIHKIVKSARSRIAILADQKYCNHHLHNNAKGLRWSSDFSERRSSTFRKTRNTKATTHGHVEDVFANTTAAATAAAAAA